ncbi:MAG: cation-translocating P-type ATPase [Bacteroidales bacterium]|nr:cation-translocating P-type ATPase [Bacteroidales bacterium]
MKRIIEFLESPLMVVIGGVALASSFILVLKEIQTAFDPAWIAIVICGLPIYFSALKKLFIGKKISSPLLISIAMTACIFIGEVFAAGEVAFIMAIGEMLEDFAVNRSRRGISKLISLAPDKARRINNQNLEEIPAKEIVEGDIVRVLPGEKITVDGVIISGSTSVDESVITGESLPRDKTLGDKVFCGTINCNGSVDVRAEKSGKDTSIEKMIKLVSEAENKKAPSQRIADKWASWLVPAALLTAVITWLITGDLQRGVTVLVVFCPCSLVLATPVSIIAGIGQAAKKGVLIKSGQALETLSEVSFMTFDKTGTITLGKPSVSDVIGFEGFSSDEVLQITASVENFSQHPLAKAVVKACKAELLHAETFLSVSGKGVSAVVDGKKILCGTMDFLMENSVQLTENQIDKVNAYSMQGKAVILTSISGKAAGIISLSDTLRPQAQTVISELKTFGVEPMILTGDNQQAAEYMALKVGVKKVYAGLLPEGKVSKIQEIQSGKGVVCMIGDGVNDAPALKTSDVSVAMGAIGSDVAIESADIALMGDDISKLPYLKRLSRAVVRSIRFNISLSMTINFIAVTLSVLGLLNPVLGALVHNAGSIIVVLNAALLYDRKI